MPPSGVRARVTVYVLGFNCNVFNSAACLVKDGRVVAAAQEERFVRRKHTGEFPLEAIRYCLDEGGITIDDVAHVGFHWRPFHRFHRRLLLIARGLPDSLHFYGTHGARWREMVTAPRTLARLVPHRGSRPSYRFHRVTHHLCHAASAFLASPWEEAATLTIDGSGEMASSTFGIGRGSDLQLFRQIDFPHSLGYLYVALTHYLGFVPDSDEYKVMALAAYGGPSRYYDLFRDIVTLLPDGGYRIDLSYMAYQRGLRDPWVSPRFVEAFGPLRRQDEPIDSRHQDIAWALQRRLEDTVLHMARALHRRTGLDRLCYAGGTALNSVLNRRLLEETPFRDVYVQAAANDAGTGFGSALYLSGTVGGQPRGGPLEHVYLGPAYSGERCRSALAAGGLTGERCGDDALVERAARFLADGKVIGWFQGRMELGPRALGHRSILADPRPAEMKDIVNARIKHREAFRPFAPAVLEEKASTYFEMDRPSPYMLFVYPIRPAHLKTIAAVAHVDGTARVQTVNAAHAPLFSRLIEAFGRITGVPIVMNTSFNDRGEPIVCTPEDAVRTFGTTGLDAMAVGPYWVVREAGGR